MNSIEEQKRLVRRNKILAIILGAIALASVSMAIIWFTIYAPVILER